MVKIEEVSGTEVLGVKAPTLTEMKSRPCSLEELQAAVVQLAEIANSNQEQFRKLVRTVEGKADRQWRATI